MRIDVITIFPDYFAPLSLSLIGKAQDKSLLDIVVHDLREFTYDVHRTVDDTPYGGGAGMVMKPEPWGEALDVIIAKSKTPPTLIFPTPAGELFTQTKAASFAITPNLIFACGRYEGIDARVVEHYRGRADVAEVVEVSIGDYVLNGGEVAVLAMIEALARLIPGVVGNPDSLVEESHGEDGLLEYPVYTKPPVFRELTVPEILLSGNHAKIAGWRAERARAITAERRPDLL
ncbi:MAG TPA: tRNA (guanosine(37)-N1)-methyltransferase TrmD [Candidatus Nanopelagicaceae bacterium]|nr:tRNA (guanosine(37)-N1)-methyltransferase TrmD [Candidatus Nanopelagicaceae bacterium]